MVDLSLAMARLDRTASTITSPTTWTPSNIPSLCRLFAALVVGTNRRLERWSATTLLISSGMVLSKLLSPASTWAILMFSFEAASTPARVELVSP